MTTVQKSIRLPVKAVKEIEALAAGTGKDFSGVARDLLIEAVKMRRCPRITFADGPPADARELPAPASISGNLSLPSGDWVRITMN